MGTIKKIIERALKRPDLPILVLGFFVTLQGCYGLFGKDVTLLVAGLAILAFGVLM